MEEAKPVCHLTPHGNIEDKHLPMTEDIDFNSTEISLSLYSLLWNMTQLVPPWNVNMRGRRVKLLLFQSDFRH